MNRQKREERKRKKREKIRKAHLDHFRAQAEVAFEKKIQNQINFSQDYIPDRDDAAGWERINLFRYPKNIIKKARELFPEDKILKQWLKQGVGEHQKDKHFHLLEILLRAAFALCGPSKYFFPLMSFDREGPAYRFFWLKRSGHDTYKIAGVPKYIVVDGKEHEIVFSSHAIDRLWERTAFVTDPLKRGIIFSLVVSSFRAETTSKKDLLALINQSLNVKSVFGTQYPFGYCPFTIEKGKARLITFLLPGYTGTPEYDLGKVNVEADNVAELQKYGEMFALMGVNSFLSETQDPELVQLSQKIQ